MASIGYGIRTRCKACGKRCATWATYCLKHRLQYGEATAKERASAARLIKRGSNLDTSTTFATACASLELAQDCQAFLEKP